MAVRRLVQIIWITVFGVLLTISFQSPARAQSPEYQIKAAMLYNFALFVEWPSRAFESGTSPFVVCVLGKDPFGPWLRHEVAGTKVGARAVEIRALEKATDANSCHLLFISRSEEVHLQSVLQPLRDVPALVISDVSDATGFCRKGGMIALLMQGSKVRFELNADAAAKAGLKINSKLERVAKTSKCGEGGV